MPSMSAGVSPASSMAASAACVASVSTLRPELFEKSVEPIPTMAHLSLWSKPSFPLIGDRLARRPGRLPGRSPAEHRAGADARRPVHVREGDPRVPRDLTAARVAAQLQDVLVHLPEAGGADRLAVGEAAAVGVDRQA